MLSELLDVSESDADAVAAASYLNNKQRDKKMADLYREFKEWKTATVKESKNAGSDLLSKVRRSKVKTLVATRVSNIQLI